MAKFKAEYSFNNDEWTGKIFNEKGEQDPRSWKHADLRVLRSSVLEVVVGMSVHHFEEYVEMNGLHSYLGN